MKKLKMTKREAAITFLELCHGYLVLFAIYACAVVTSGHGNEPFIQVGLLLLPVNAILFAAVRWAGHFWQYGLIAALAVVGAVMAAGSGVRGIWMGILGVLAAISYFYARAARNTCWLESPVYPWIGIDVILYFLGGHFASDMAVRIAPILAAVYFLICNFHTNLEEVDTFLKNHATMERLPVRRLARINQGMMWIVSGLTAALSWLRSADTAAGKCFEDGDSLAVASDSQLPCGRGDHGDRTGATGDAGCRQSGTLVSGTVL